ncbi:MAG: hypothetical protein HY861_05230 [Chlamydiia bacterium]|nr:hypothetical protein [Chlamydiia bacterium]
MKSSIVLKTYQTIVDQQEKKDEQSRSYGLWPSSIVMPNNPAITLGIDHNILAGLQIMLMLHAIAKRCSLLHFEQVQNRFDIALSRFIADTKKSERTPGFIAFWPYIQYDDYVWKHNFDPTNPVFRHMDIKNEIGDSTLAAIYLMKTGQHGEHVADYAKNISSKDYETGFYTFLPALNHSGGIDLVDNIHILTAIQMLKIWYPHLISGQLLINEKNAILRVREILKRNFIKNNMLYYRRLSQFLVAFAKQKYDGFSPFNEHDSSIIEDILKGELHRSTDSYDFTERIELLLSCKFLDPLQKNVHDHLYRIKEAVAKLPAPEKSMILEGLCEDGKALRTTMTAADSLAVSSEEMSRSELGEYTSFTAKSGFMNTIIYNQFVAWHAPAHAAASALLYLTLDGHE